MNAKPVFAAVAAALFVTAAANAGPLTTIDYTAQGCELNTPLDTSSPMQTQITQSQTFKPVFSFLRRVQFVLFRTDLSRETLRFVVNLRDGYGQLIATSNEDQLSARTGYDDAAQGDSVVFVFRGRVSVDPGQSYQLELERVNVVSEAVVAAVCLLPDTYADGYWLWGSNMQAGYDMEFAATGSD
jgi:hypothetical protein